MYLMHRKYSIFNKKKENDIVKIKKKKHFSLKLNTNNKKKSFHSAVWQAVG